MPQRVNFLQFRTNFENLQNSSAFRIKLLTVYAAQRVRRRKLTHSHSEISSHTMAPRNSKKRNVKNREKFSTPSRFVYNIPFPQLFLIHQKFSTPKSFVVPSWFIAAHQRMSRDPGWQFKRSLEGEILEGREGKILIRHRDGRNIIENYPVDGGVVTRITPTVINMA